MKIKIEQVDLDGEAILLRVLRKCILSDYLIIDTTYDENNKPSNIHPHILWLPETYAEAGDTIRIEVNGSDMGWDTNKKIFTMPWDGDYKILNDTGDKLILVHVADFAVTVKKPRPRIRVASSK